MTSRWDLGSNPRPPDKEEQEEIDGSFVCQTCGQYVYSAIYLPMRKVLTWKCTNGHKSFIEDISL